MRDGQLAHWDADPVARLYPRLVRWLPLGSAFLIAAVAVATRSTWLLLVFALAAALGVLYARIARALDAVELPPDCSTLVLMSRGWSEAISMSRVRGVSFLGRGAIITIVTSSPYRQYMISLLDEPRSSFREALVDAGLVVSGR